MVAQVNDLEPGGFVHTMGDALLYLNHLDQARLQLTRKPRGLPRMRPKPEVRSFFDLRFGVVGGLDVLGQRSEPD